MRAMQCLLGTLALAAAAVCQAAPASMPANKWTHDGHDARNTSANLAELAITADNFTSLVMTGPHYLPNSQGTQPVTQNRDNTLYGCSTSGTTVFALDGATAAQIWSRTVLGIGCTGVVAGNDSLWVTSRGGYIGDTNHYVTQLDPVTGDMRWQVALTDNWTQGMTSPVVVGDLLIAAEERYNVTALDANTGAYRWRAATCHLNYRPGVANGRVFVSGWSSYCRREPPYLYAFDAASGTLLWKQPGGATDTPMVLGKQVIVASDNGGKVKAFDAATGALNWVSSVSVGWDVKMAATPTEVVAATGSHIYGLDWASGALNWTVTIDTGEFITSTLAVTGRGVLFTIGTGLSYYNRDSRLVMIPHTGAKRLLSHPLARGLDPGYGLSVSAANGRVQITNRPSGYIHLLTLPSP